MIDSNIGYISAINGTLINIKGLEGSTRIHDLIKISNHNILGEVIHKYSDHVVAQCFESTINVKLREEVIDLQEPLSMELAPGLIANIFDGIQRPLEMIFKNTGVGELSRGIEFPSLSRNKKWHFKPMSKINDLLNGGDIIGTVQETLSIEHKILVPPNASGILCYIAEEGDYKIEDNLYILKKDDKEVSYSMIQKWPINIKRPFVHRINPYEPLITGIRVIDLLFPIAKGGTVAIPGGFGTGKTILQHSIAKWCNADVIVYIGCGEPGNEIADILKQFIETIDPKSGQILFDRVVFIANTSNMPVSAREASLFSGITIAEYYRDMGYDVAVLADSISRWAESLREISGLLEEMPAEEGYPAYLPSRLSSFYERAGVAQIFGKNRSKNETTGSITILGTISPPAGDFSEPVTAITKRLVQTFWALDSKLAYLKHYPAINWLNSYSNYADYISEWWNKKDIDWEEIDIDWFECRREINEILSIENDLKYLTQLAGEKNLPLNQQLILYLADMIKNGFLIQSAFDDIDKFTNYKKLLGFVKILLLLYYKGLEVVGKGQIFEDVVNDDLINEILRIGYSVPNEDFSKIEEIKEKILTNLTI